MVGTIVYQLTRDMTPEQIEAAGFGDYFVDHTAGVYPQAASGTPFSAATFAVTGDPIADLNEDLAAEQKARLSYDNILRFAADDPDVAEPIKFLRAREIVHYQRFGETNHTDLSRIYPLWAAAHRGYSSWTSLPKRQRVDFYRKIRNFFTRIKKSNRQGHLAPAVCYMFQSTFVLPSSLITILCIIIMATAFLRL